MTASHETYKLFVDELVDLSRSNVTAGRIREHGHPVRANDEFLALDEDEAQLKAVFSRLGDADKQALARAFEAERIEALHDVAAFLEWALSARGMKIAWGEGEVSASPFNGMPQDFIGRVSGDEWSKYE